MNKITITLKQHTPLLHFQPMQEGATLRASEVKPKLDKFLIKKLGGGNYENGVNIARGKGWLIGDSTALNYKMLIQSSGELDVQIDENPKFGIPFVLSNMGKEEIETDLVMYDSNTITLIFLSNVSSISLINFIVGKDKFIDNKRLLQGFFVLHNFGQRATKGFGSYTMTKTEVVIGTTKELMEIEPINSNLMPSETPYMIFDLPNKNEYEMQKAMFSVLDFYWKVLKSGVNYTRDRQYEERYIKSFLYIYLRDKGLTWEKKFLKTNLSLVTQTKNDNEGEKLKSSFARALLGMPEVYEYRNVKKKIEVSCCDKTDDGSINRISSPIIFKPIKVNSGEARICVFILFDEELITKINSIPEKSRKFTFESKPLKEKHSIKTTGLSKTTELKIDVNAIDYHELIHKYHKYLNDEKELIPDYSRPKDAPYLKMVPKDFPWNDILSKAKNNYVIFRTTSKK